MIYKHDVSNGQGRYIYSVNGVQVGKSIEESDAEIESRLGDTVVLWKGSKAQLAEQGAYDLKSGLRKREKEFKKLSPYQQNELIIDALLAIPETKGTALDLWYNGIKKDISKD